MNVEMTLEDKAVELITSMQNLAEPATQLAISAVRTAALIDVLLACVWLVAAFFGVRYLMPKLSEWMERDRFGDSFVDFMMGLAVLSAGVSAVVLSAIAIITLLSTSTWLGIFAPELALAYALIEKMT